MGTRYWVGNGGSVSDTAHWSTTDGGSGGASEPTLSDDVFFTSNSFSSGSQEVTGDITCKSIDFSGVTNTPYFNGDLYPSGSVTFVADMTTNNSKSVYWSISVDDTTTEFTAPNKTFNSLYFTGTFSGCKNYIFSDINAAIVSSGDGELYTNGFNINCDQFTGSGLASPKLYMGSSIITCKLWQYLSEVDAGTSKIILTGDPDLQFYCSEYDRAYYDIEFQCEGLALLNCTRDTTFNSILIIGSNTEETQLKVRGFTCDDVQMYGNTSYNLLIINYASSTTYWIQTTADIVLNYCDITYMEKKGTGSITAYNSIDSGNNIDVTFSIPTGFNIFLGDAEVTSIYLGTVEIAEVYLGSQTLK